MSTYNFLENVFNQMLTNPRATQQELLDQIVLKEQFELKYGNKNYFLISSSGTGQAEKESVKLIALHHDAIMKSAARVNHHFNLTAQMPWGCVLPLFHVAALGVCARAFLAKAKVYQSSWKVDEFSNWITANQIQLVSLVPTQIYDLIEKNINAPTSLKIVFVGGTRLQDSMRKKIMALGWPIVETYGMTETASMIAVGQADKYQIMPEVQVSLDEGLLRIQCNSLMTCSVQKVDGLVQFTSPQKNGFKTSDLAEIEKIGMNAFLKILGRDSEFIKIHAEGVSLTHLRETLGDDNQCAVVAMTNDRSEYEIVLARKNNYDYRTRVESYNSKVRPFERIKKVYTVDQLPVTSVGKVKYNLLTEMLRGLPYEEI